jgi:23S rRNA (pseudouridine1915-N3)-methyltransferase
MPVPLFTINIVAVGKIKDRALAEKINDLCSRILFDAKFTIQEIKDSDKESEGIRLMELANAGNSFSIALSEEGREFTSEEFAKFLQTIPSRTINFCIGGHHGLSDHAKRSSKALVSLSKMTFTHDMARLLLVEQIYRAVSIIKNRGYHR